MLTLKVVLFVCTQKSILQISLCGDLPLVMPDSISVGCRPTLLCPAETQMINPNSVTGTLVQGKSTVGSRIHLPLAGHLALLLVVALGAEDIVAVPRAPAVAEAALLVATAVAVAGGAALGPHAPDKCAARAPVAGELGAADLLPGVSGEVGGVFSARAHNHFGG